MKFTVDSALCTGHGRCYTLAAEVYAADDDGFNTRRGETVTVDPDQQDAAVLGATSCPEQAIEISD